MASSERATRMSCSVPSPPTTPLSTATPWSLARIASAEYCGCVDDSSSGAVTPLPIAVGPVADPVAGPLAQTAVAAGPRPDAAVTGPSRVARRSRHAVDGADLRQRAGVHRPHRQRRRRFALGRDGIGRREDGRRGGSHGPRRPRRACARGPPARVDRLPPAGTAAALAGAGREDERANRGRQGRAAKTARTVGSRAKRQDGEKHDGVRRDRGAERTADAVSALIERGAYRRWPRPARAGRSWNEAAIARRRMSFRRRRLERGRRRRRAQRRLKATSIVT